MAANIGLIQLEPWAQLPDITLCVDRYFEFLQRQIKLAGELTATWVSAMNTLSAIMLGHARVAESAAEPDPDDRLFRQESPAADAFDEVLDLLVDEDIIADVSEQVTAM